MVGRAVERVLIIGPKMALERWTEEFSIWAPHYQVLSATGSKKDCRDVLAKAAVSEAPWLVVLTNYEAARRDVELLVGLRPQALIVDESHRLKNRRTKSFEAVKQIAVAAPILVLVTGTPLVNRPDELWAQLHLIDPKRWSSYWRFVDSFCATDVVENRKTQEKVKVVTGMKPGTDAVLRQQLRDVMIRKSIRELLPELPEVTEITVPVQLSAPERKLYDQMAKFYFAQNDDASQGPEMSVIAPNDVSKITRLRQLADDWGLLAGGEGEVPMSSKMKALIELANEDLAGHPVVIFSCFSTVVDRIAAELNCAKIHGSVPQNDRQGIVDAFQAGQIDRLVGTIGSMSESIDLYRSHHVVFFDRDWTPRANRQAIGRVLRYGQQSNAVFSYSLIASKTIDVYVEKVLATKQNVVDSLVGRSWNEVANPDG